MMDLIDLREAYEEAGEFAHLKEPHIKYVPGRGSEKPVAMLLGEAPGATENLEGKPFVGRSGRVLDQLMALAGLSADPDDEARAYNAYITNTVKYRPPGNRTPTRAEIEKSLSWIRKEWKILGRPPIIVTIGAVPTRCILKDRYSMTELAGQPQPIAAGGPIVWPMFHPAHALRNPSMRPVCEEDWQALGAWLKEEGLA